MTGRVAVVTGASRGIGLAVATRLAAGGARVILVCRDRHRGGDALEQVRAASPVEEGDLVVADLASLAAVRAAAVAIARSAACVHALVHVAGVFPMTRRTSTDGFELALAVNHFAPFALTHLLRAQLVAGAPSRVVSVSSYLHRKGRLDLDDLPLERGFSGPAAYCRSKLAQVLFTRELARRAAAEGVHANAVSPGRVATDIAREQPWLNRIVGRLIGRSPDEGAAPVVRAASAPELASATGRYFERFADEEPAPAARDDALAGRLFDESARLVGVAAW
jgi:NAD(P)-dependent dehydrogenase (short-subunit alcohol dehydrogenase family)